MKPKHVIVIKTDRQRGDTVGVPNLDRVAGQGVAFMKAYCCRATCTTSHTMFYTGQYAHDPHSLFAGSTLPEPEK